MAKKGKGSGGSMDFKVTASGLDKVNKDAKKTGQNFNTLDKNARSTDRAMKGVSNMSSNTTKNFSKMSQGITGGLVPAYATLAAQLFALDALFRFFREAADFRVLQKGQELFAASTGRAMRTLSKDIQMATSAQITFKEASQSAAIGLAAGLSPTQLNELGKAARTVSVALGRDTTDSFNRLIRGVTKAEPELLDELGIILRLEEATTRYAASLGLNKNQLTTFQKSQAVANEVLRQSESRYGAIADMIGDDSVNQLNKLMVAFDEVLNRVRLAIAPLAEFFGTFLADNIESATAAIGVFAASISGGLIRGMMPQIDYERSAAVAAGVTGSGDLKVTKRMSQERIDRLTSGKGTRADIAAYEAATKRKESIMLKFENFTRREHQKTVRILKAQRQRMVADANVGFERMKANFIADLYEMEAVHGVVMGRMKFVGMQFGKAMNAVLRFAGLIGIAVMIFQMGKQLFDMFRDVDEAQEKAIEKTKEHTEAMESLADEIQKTANFYKEGLFAGAEDRIRAVGGAFQSADIATRIDQVETAFFRLGPDHEATQGAITGLQNVAFNLATFNPKFAEFARLLAEDPMAAFEMEDELMAFAQAAIEAGQAVDGLTRAQANYDKQFNAFIQKAPKIQFQDIIMSLETMAKEQEKLANSSESSAAEQEVFAAKLEVTKLRLNAFATAFEMATARQMEFVEARRQSLKGMTALFGQKQDIANAFKLAEQVNKILQKREDIFGMQLAIDNMQEGTEKRIAQQRLNMSKQLLKEEKERLAMMMAAQNKVLSAFSQAAESFGKDLGAALGKVFRGESVDLKAFGKKMTEILTNSLGEAISNRIMRIAYRGTPLDPDVQISKYTKEVEQMLEQGGRDHSAKLKAVGDDNSTNAHTALTEGGDHASIQIHESLEMGGNTASETIFNRMVSAADYHSDKIKTAQRDMLQAEFDFLTIEKNKIDKDIQEIETKIEGGTEGIIAERNKLKYEFQKILAENRLLPANRNERNDAFFGKTSIFLPTLIDDKFTESDFDLAMKKEFDSVRGPQFDLYGNTGIDDARTYVGDEYTKMIQRANVAINNNDVASLRQIMAEYDSYGNETFRQRLANSGDPILASVPMFFENLRENITAFDNLNKEVNNGEKVIRDLNEEHDELTTTSESLAKRIKELEKDIENTGLKDVNVVADKGADGSGSFSPNPAGDFTPGGTSDGNETGSPVGAAGGKTGPMSFQEQTEQLFPNLFETLGDADTGVAGFAKSTLHFSTVITQFGTLVAQGMALSGKQEEAADIMLEVAKIQMALAIAEMATKIGLSFAPAPARYGNSFMYGGYTHGGVTDGPEAGYNVRMHGREAIVPLGNDRSIPVKMQGGVGQNNVNVTVNVDQSGSSESFLTADGGAALGKTIAAIATDTIAKEQRAGGLLSRI